MNILHIDSSIQGDASVSRRLTAAIVSQLQAISPSATATYRDLAQDPVPHFSPAVLESASGAASPSSDSVALDIVLDEVLGADVIVIGAPMYNFSIPSQLKAWLDALVVPGRTFQYEAGTVKGLLGSKKVIVASSRGGLYGPDSPFAVAEHQESLLRTLLGFIGITDITVIRAEGVRLGEDHAARSVEAALQEVAAMGQSMAA